MPKCLVAEVSGSILISKLPNAGQQQRSSSGGGGGAYNSACTGCGCIIQAYRWINAVARLRVADRHSNEMHGPRQLRVDVLVVENCNENANKKGL